MLKNKIVQFSITFGAYLGVILMAYNLILYFTGQITNSFLGSFNYAIYAIGFYFIIKYYRDNENNNTLTIKEGWKIGIFVGTLAGVFVGFYTVLLYKVLDPGVIDEMMRLVENTMRETGKINEIDLEKQLSLQRTLLSSVWFIMFSSLFGGAMMGAIFGLINSLILKKLPLNPFQNSDIQ